MLQLAREKDDSVLLRNNRLERAIADVFGFLQTRIVNTQLPAFKLTGLAVEEVHEREMPC